MTGTQKHDICMEWNFNLYEILPFTQQFLKDNDLHYNVGEYHHSKHARISKKYLRYLNTCIASTCEAVAHRPSFQLALFKPMRVIASI